MRMYLLLSIPIISACSEAVLFPLQENRKGSVITTLKNRVGRSIWLFRVLKVRFLSGVGQPNQSWVVSATEPDLKMKDHILIAGGSGFVGQRLTSLLQESGHQVSWLSRKSGQEGAVNRIAWDPSGNSWAKMPLMASPGWSSFRAKALLTSDGQINANN